MKHGCQINALHKKNVSHESIKTKKIAVIGLGGIGSNLVEQLVRTGFTNLLIFDADIVSESNLSRQKYRFQDINFKKGERLVEQLSEIEPGHNVEWINDFLNDSNVHLLDGCSIVLDATDNLKTRYIINTFCYAKNIPWIYASAIGSLSATAAFIPDVTPCFECLYGPFTEEIEVSCSIEGVLSPALLETVSQQLLLCIRVLSGNPVRTFLLTKDVWNGNQSEFDFSALLDENCPSCSNFNSEAFVTPYLNMKCNGLATDVWLKETDSLVKRIKDEFVITKENPVFCEYTLNEKRILIYKQKKATFHQFETPEIIELLKN